MAVSIGIIINYRNRKNKKGLYSIHMRVTIDNVHRYYPVPLPVKVSMEDWTGNDLYGVAETNPYNLEINEAINQTAPGSSIFTEACIPRKGSSLLSC